MAKSNWANPGDTIRIKHDWARSADVRAGDVFTVASIGFTPDGVIVYGPMPWAFRAEDFEIVARGKPAGPKIIITTDGRVTTARMFEGKRVVREAKATCSPKDRFDFEDGADLAFDRLLNGPDATGPIAYDTLREWAAALDGVAARIREAINE